MDRRKFLAMTGALAASAALPEVSIQNGPMFAFWERGWDWSATQNPESMWWTLLAEFKPTGVKYGYVVSTTYLVDRGITAEEVLARQLSRVDPHYAS